VATSWISSKEIFSYELLFTAAKKVGNKNRLLPKLLTEKIVYFMGANRVAVANVFFLSDVNTLT
jgi:hypothetical protein